MYIVCNPFGGMGLTGGIVDVGGLYDCLNGIHQDLADDAILDKYSEVRRAKYNEIVDPVSSANIRRLFDQDPETAGEKDEFFLLCKKAESDPALARQMQHGANALKYDFTQHYQARQQSAQQGPAPVTVGSERVPVAISVAD
jgi:2-polyprenyl-6-methoxyphenol hydroxylase-like FAD-dependent oxidoreductase